MLKTRRFELLPHPTQNSLAQAVALYASIGINGSVITTEFEYESESIGLKIPELRQGVPSRLDELWKTTCFELFLQPEGRKNYWEINFSPRGDWNVYAFDSYREGMKVEPRVGAATLEQLQFDERKCKCRFSVNLVGLALRHFELRIGATAVLETADGVKSYWAIKHASDKPDFHKPESFTYRAMIGT